MNRRSEAAIRTSMRPWPELLQIRSMFEPAARRTSSAPERIRSSEIGRLSPPFDRILALMPGFELRVTPQ